MTATNAARLPRLLFYAGALVAVFLGWRAYRMPPELREPAVAAFGIAAGVTACLLAVRGIAEGTVRRSIRRSASPTTFWVAIGMYLVIGAILIVTSATRL